MQGFPAYGSCLAIRPSNYKGSLDGASMRSDIRANTIHLVVHIYAVSYRTLMAVFHDQVLVKEAKGLFIRRGRQTNDESVEVLKHAAPLIIDAAVALIGDDDVKGLDRHIGIVAYLFGRLAIYLIVLIEQRTLLLCRVKLRLACKDGVEALNGGDTDFRYRINGIVLQVLDVVKLGELRPSSGV